MSTVVDIVDRVFISIGLRLSTFFYTFYSAVSLHIVVCSCVQCKNTILNVNTIKHNNEIIFIYSNLMIVIVTYK